MIAAGSNSVLVVDDDALSLDVLQRLLEGAGYAVQRVGDGAAALKLLLKAKGSGAMPWSS